MVHKLGLNETFHKLDLVWVLLVCTSVVYRPWHGLLPVPLSTYRTVTICIAMSSRRGDFIQERCS